MQLSSQVSSETDPYVDDFVAVSNREFTFQGERSRGLTESYCQATACWRFLPSTAPTIAATAAGTKNIPMEAAPAKQNSNNRMAEVQPEVLHRRHIRLV